MTHACYRAVLVLWKEVRCGCMSRVLRGPQVGGAGPFDPVITSDFCAEGLLTEGG